MKQKPWIKKTSMIIIGCLITGIITLFFNNVYEVSNLKAEVSKQEEKITSNKECCKSNNTKLDEIHWYLIERNNIKVPEKINSCSGK